MQRADPRRAGGEPATSPGGAKRSLPALSPARSHFEMHYGAAPRTSPRRLRVDPPGWLAPPQAAPGAMSSEHEPPSGDALSVACHGARAPSIRIITHSPWGKTPMLARGTGAPPIWLAAALALALIPAAFAIAWARATPALEARDPLLPMLRRIDRYLQRNETDGVVLDWRWV